MNTSPSIIDWQATALLPRTEYAGRERLAALDGGLLDPDRRDLESYRWPLTRLRAAQHQYPEGFARVGPRGILARHVWAELNFREGDSPHARSPLPTVTVAPERVAVGCTPNNRGSSTSPGRGGADHQRSDWREFRVVMLNGSRDTHKHSGSDYSTRSLGSIFDGAASPAKCEKHDAPAMIPSTYCRFDARAHQVQRQMGQFASVNGDIDYGNVPLEKVQQLVDAFFGSDAAVLIYTSSSATPEDQRWRIVVPLAMLLSFCDWHDMTTAFYTFMEANGVTMDWALVRAGQPVYLPNVRPDRRGPDGAPLFYLHQLRDGRGCALADQFAASQIAKLRAQRAAEEEAKSRARDEARQSKPLRKQYRSDADSLIAQFNAQHPLAEMLRANGYEQSPGNDADWRSPYQSSGSFATRVFDDYWVSLSESDATAGLGIETKSGSRTGDAFDVHCHFDHGGDPASALRAYAMEQAANGDTGAGVDITALLESLRSQSESVPPPAATDAPLGTTGGSVGTVGDGGAAGGDTVSDDDGSPYSPEDEAEDLAVLAAKMPTIDQEAFYGVLGPVTRAATENSEATSVGVAISLMARVSMLLRPFYVPLGDEKPGLNIFVLQVGQSALARKGTSAEFANRRLAPMLQSMAAGVSDQVRGRTDRIVSLRVALARAIDAHEAAVTTLQDAESCTPEALLAMQTEITDLKEIIGRRKEAVAKAEAGREKAFGTGGYERRGKTIDAAQAELEAIITTLLSLEARFDALSKVLQDRDGAIAELRRAVDLCQQEVDRARRAQEAPTHATQHWEAGLAALASPPIIMTGISSGEGIIYAIRDPAERADHTGQKDPGVDEKRLLIELSEYGSALSLMRRAGSTLSAVMRDAYDGRPLATNAKNEPVKCQQPYVTISAAITPAELAGLLFDNRDAGAQADNGVGNRNLYAFVQRTKIVSMPKETKGVDLLARMIWTNLAKVYRAANAGTAPCSIPYEFDEEGQAEWERIYTELTQRTPASANASRLYGRLEINCRKLACIIAAMNGESRVTAGAVRAAHAWVRYCADTVDVIASTMADRLQFRVVAANATKIIDALTEMGGSGKARDVRRKTHLSGAAMKTSISYLLTKAPAVIVVEEQTVAGGKGAKQKVPWLRNLRGGAGNPDTAISGYPAISIRAKGPRRQDHHEQKTPQEPLTAVQGEGGLGCDSRREDLGRISQAA